MRKHLGKYWISSVFNQINQHANQNTSWNVPAGQDRSKLKRAPIAVRYLGTVAQYRDDPLSTPFQNGKRQKLFTKALEKNDRVLKRAIDILSQSDTGRYLLSEMTKNGYSIVFDARRTGMSGAGGLCDSDKKQIILNHETDPYYVALVIGHEAVHALQSTKKGLFPSSAHRPEEGIRLSFAIEADAYAQQTQIALELAHGSAGGPKNQITYKQPLAQMRRRFPQIVKAAESTFREHKALIDGRVVSAAFRAFYDDPNLRSFYEDMHMGWVDKMAPELTKNCVDRRVHFNKRAAPDKLKDKITHMGRPYLKEGLKGISLNAVRYAGVTKETNTKIDTFYQKYKPKSKPRVVKEYGVYVKDSASWVLGWKTRTGSVIVKNKNNKPPKKPPMRPPAA